MIFLQGERTNWNIINHNESTHQFIDRSAWPMCAFARNFINEWLLKMNADAELISKVKSDNNKQHDGALAEILMYAICKGCGMTIHRIAQIPDIKTPDFEINLLGGDRVILECSLASNAMESAEDKLKKDAVIQIIEDLEDFSFGITISFDTVSNESISKKEFLHFIKDISLKYLSVLPDNVLSRPFLYHGQGWQFEMRFLRKKCVDDRTFLTTSGPTKTIDNYKSLYNALNDKKPGKYKVDREPFVICLGIDDLTANESEFSEVLFGQSGNDINLKYEGDGFLIRKGRSVNTKVSAVIFAKSLKLFGLDSFQPIILHNPFAVNPLPTGLFPFAEFVYIISESKLIKTRVHDTRDVFPILGVNRQEYQDYFMHENRSSRSQCDN
jgi:hypothetical protein